MKLSLKTLILLASIIFTSNIANADSWSTNSLGITSGTLGGQSFSSSTNSLGITTCY